MLSSAKLSLLLCIGSVLHSHADDCDVGTIDDTCVTGNGDEEVKSLIFVGCSSCSALHVLYRVTCNASLVYVQYACQNNRGHSQLQATDQLHHKVYWSRSQTVLLDHVSHNDERLYWQLFSILLLSGCIVVAGYLDTNVPCTDETAVRGQSQCTPTIRAVNTPRFHPAFAQPSVPLATAAATPQFFFCTDRYRWEWSQDVSQLPNQASDSLCITFDSDIVDGLNNSES